MTSDRTDSSEDHPQRPTNDDPEARRAHWRALGQAWRNEPEIDEQRKEELTRRRAIMPDPDRAPYPFLEVELSRRDVEWLLETHDNGSGPVDWLMEPDRQGLDLRGAILTQTDLSHLPLSTTYLEGADLRKARLEGTDLRKAHLEDAILEKAHLEGTLLWEAHLEGAILREAHLEDASLMEAHLEGAKLWGARLEGAILERVRLEGAILREAHLEDASLMEAHLKGKKMPHSDLERLRKWNETFPEMLLPADLRGAFLDVGTNLSNISLVGTEHVGPRLADVRWGDVNLAVVEEEWEGVDELSDEHYADDLQDYKAAVRANRQLAVVLREQGINEVADHFHYRYQVLQRKVFRMQKRRKEHSFSLVSWLLAGYGYRPWWTLGWYVGVISVCALLYWLLGMNYYEAIVGSVTAFHGRGLFNGQPNGWEGGVAAIEAFLGLVIEIAFIVTFTQRFFGK